MKKYFDYVATHELNDLFHTGQSQVYMHKPYPNPNPNPNTGIKGTKVKVFGTSMDTPGRSELIGSS